MKQAGFGVLLPIGENTRYDLAIEDAGALYLVQCKTGHLTKGAVMFRTSSSYYHHPNPKMPAKHYRGEVDFFGVYCVESGGVYLVPIAAVRVDQHASLRVEPPRNNQLQRVRWARDYEIGTVAIGGLRAPSGA